MKRHYYGFYNSYGINTTDSDGGRIGTLRVFGSVKGVKEWVNNDNTQDGSIHRERISAKEARKFINHDSEFQSYVYYYGGVENTVQNYVNFVEAKETENGAPYIVY